MLIQHCLLHSTSSSLLLWMQASTMCSICAPGCLSELWDPNLQLNSHATLSEAPAAEIWEQSVCSKRYSLVPPIQTREYLCTLRCAI
ncbi:hypothetical protein C8Q72DRAFT_858936 [Fomitopsis betulina]|nr:hypothetical protein C8Q72DRAFT_858936 [Fomitopsis betulina]